MVGKNLNFDMACTSPPFFKVDRGLTEYPARILARAFVCRGQGGFGIHPPDASSAFADKTGMAVRVGVEDQRANLGSTLTVEVSDRAHETHWRLATVDDSNTGELSRH